MKKAMNKVLIMDGHNMMYRQYHSLARLTNKGKPVSIIYGLPLLVSSYLKRFNPKEAILVWDGRKSAIRKSLLPDYKLRDKRVDMDMEDIFSQREVVMEIFSYLGLNQVHNPDQEADDLIYMLTRKHTKAGNRVVIASNDKDFHQLISKRVNVINAKEVLLTPNNLLDNFNYSPQQVVDYLCLDGDKSDKIPGYPGMGEKRISLFFSEFASITEYLQSNKTLKHLDKKRLEEIYERNRQLIDLNLYYKKYLKGNAKIRYIPRKNPEMNIKALKKICARYSIVSFNRSSFINPFIALKDDNESSI